MKWQSSNIYNLILPAAATGLLYIRFEFSMTIIKGIILFLILLFAANSDLKIREVSNWVPFAIFITGFIGISLKDLPIMFIGALLLPLPLLISALINPYSIGGADIKVMATCSFLLGIEHSLVAITVGLTVAVVSVSIRCLKAKRKIRNESFPLIPFLAFGSFLAFLI